MSEPTKQMTLEDQKKDLLSAIEFLRSVERSVNQQLFALKEGLDAIEKGEDMFESNSDVAEGVRDIMQGLSKLK